MDICYEFIENNLNTADDLAEGLLIRLKISKESFKTMMWIQKAVRSMMDIYRELLYKTCYKPVEECKNCTINIDGNIHKTAEESLKKIVRVGEVLEDAFKGFLFLRLYLKLFVLPPIRKMIDMADDFDVVVNTLQSGDSETVSRKELLNTIN